MAALAQDTHPGLWDTHALLLLIPNGVALLNNRFLKTYALSTSEAVIELYLLPDNHLKRWVRRHCYPYCVISISLSNHVDAGITPPTTPSRLKLSSPHIHFPLKTHQILVNLQQIKPPSYNTPVIMKASLCPNVEATLLDLRSPKAVHYKSYIHQQLEEMAKAPESGPTSDSEVIMKHLLKLKERTMEAYTKNRSERALHYLTLLDKMIQIEVNQVMELYKQCCFEQADSAPPAQSSQSDKMI